MTTEKIILYSQKEIASRALAGEIISSKISEDVLLTDDFDDFCDMILKNDFLAIIVDDPDIVQRENILNNAKSTPVIFLCSAVIEKTTAHVVLKPFRLSVFLSTLLSAVNRFKNSDETSFDLGNGFFHPVKKTITTKDSVINLTDKESVLLSLLIKSKKPMTKEQLLQDVWNAGNGVDSHTPETHIYALRQKLLPTQTEIVSEKDGYFLKNRFNDVF